MDVTVLKVEGRQFTVRACTGDQNLGGVDIDNALMTHIIRVIYEAYGEDLSQNDRAKTRITTKCREAKHILQADGCVNADILIEGLLD